MPPSPQRRTPSPPTAPPRPEHRAGLRRASRALAAVGLLAALLPAPPAGAQATATAAGAPFRIVALGSSSTQGTGASSPGMSYPAQLQRLFAAAYRGRPEVGVANRGVAGEDIDDMVRRIDPDVLAAHPDLVVWQAGSNDSLRGVPLERFKAELRDGIAAMRAGGAEVLLMEPQWSPVIEKADAKSRFVDAVREVGAEAHVDVVRRFALMRAWVADGLVTPQDLVGPDNLHMTDRGYTLLAQAVLDQISTASLAFRARRAVATAGRP